jgi:MFS family permease
VSNANGGNVHWVIRIPACMRTRLKLSISWLILALVCLVGLIACVGLGLIVVSLSDRSPAWYLGWFAAIGIALLGLTFLIGPLVALQHRRLAGVLFLAVMPVGAFCLAYPSSGFWVWRDGGGWFETPFPSTAIGLAILFYAPFVPPLLMWRRKRRAAIAFALTAFIAGLTFANSRWTPALLPGLAGWSILFLFPGLFWVRTDKLGWPSLVQARPTSRTKRVSAFAAACVAISGWVRL